MKVDKIIVFGAVVMLTATAGVFGADRNAETAPPKKDIIARETHQSGQNKTKQKDIADKEKPELPEQASDRAKEVTDIIWEHEFDEPVGDAIFGERGVTAAEARKLGWAISKDKKDSENVKVPYAKMKVIPDFERSVSFSEGKYSEKRIEFYDKNANAIKTRERGTFEQFVISNNGKYVMVKRKIPYSNLLGEPGYSGGELYRNDGTLLWKSEIGPHFIDVSNEGYVVAGELMPGEEAPRDFVFYDPQGNEVGRIKNPGIEWGFGSAKFSRSGEYVIIGYSDLVEKKSVIYLCEKNGTKLWVKELPLSSKFPFRFDIDENIGVLGVGYSDISYAYAIDWQGNLLWKIPLGNRGGLIPKASDDGRVVYIVSGIGYIWCIDKEKGQILWEREEDLKLTSWDLPLGKIPYYHRVTVINDRLYVWGGTAISKGGVWKPLLVLLSVFDAETGKLLHRKEYPNKLITLIERNGKVYLLNVEEGKISKIK